MLTPSLRWLDLTQMVMDIWKQLQISIFIIPSNFCSNIIAKTSFPGTHRGQYPTPCSPRPLDFTQMVLDIQKQLQIPIFIIPNNFCSNNIAKKSFPGTHRGQCPTPCSPMPLDFTQMVLDIQKQLQIPIFINPNNFCSNNIAKKSFPGTHRGRCPTPGSQRCLELDAATPWIDLKGQFFWP